MADDYYSSGSGCQGTASARSVSVRNYGDPIAADPPGGWGGWGLGKPDRTVWPTARLSVAGTPVPTYDDAFPKAPPTPPPTHPARPLRGAHGRIDDSSGEALVRDLKRVRAPNLPTTGLSSAVIVGQFHERPSLLDSAARARRGGRERRVGLRKPVVVRRDRRTAYRHSGGLLDGPIGFPKAHPSLPPGERAVRVRTETLPRGPCRRSHRARKRPTMIPSR